MSGDFNLPNIPMDVSSTVDSSENGEIDDSAGSFWMLDFDDSNSSFIRSYSIRSVKFS